MNTILLSMLGALRGERYKLALFGFGFLTAKGGFIFIILCQNWLYLNSAPPANWLCFEKKRADL